MIKKWFIEIIALLISINSMTQLHGANEIRSSKQTVREVEHAYQRGAYDGFLRKLHEQYQRAGKAGILKAILEKAKPSQSLLIDQSKLEEIEKERNRKLLEVATEHPESTLAQKIESIVFSSPTFSQRKVLKELEALKLSFPKTTTFTVENKIQHLENEYYIKTLLLDINSLHRKIPIQKFSDKKVVIVLEKLAKMEEIAKQFNHVNWMEKLERAKEAFRIDYAYRMDLHELQQEKEGHVAENLLALKIKEIMMNYHTQKALLLDSEQIVQNK